MFNILTDVDIFEQICYVDGLSFDLVPARHAWSLDWIDGKTPSM